MFICNAWFAMLHHYYSTYSFHAFTHAQSAWETTSNWSLFIMTDSTNMTELMRTVTCWIWKWCWARILFGIGYIGAQVMLKFSNMFSFNAKVFLWFTTSCKIASITKGIPLMVWISATPMIYSFDNKVILVFKNIIWSNEATLPAEEMFSAAAYSTKIISIRYLFIAVVFWDTVKNFVLCTTREIIDMKTSGSAKENNLEQNIVLQLQRKSW